MCALDLLSLRRCRHMVLTSLSPYSSALEMALRASNIVKMSLQLYPTHTCLLRVMEMGKYWAMRLSALRLTRTRGAAM